MRFRGFRLQRTIWGDKAEPSVVPMSGGFAVWAPTLFISFAQQLRQLRHVDRDPPSQSLLEASCSFRD
jgi:hypothetical protein